MKRTLISFAVLGTILGAMSAQAGGLDRSGQNTSIILKEGNLLEITSVTVATAVTGAYTSGAKASITDVSPDYSFLNLAFRTDISDDIALAIIQDEPYGASVDWTSLNGVTPSYKGVKAEVKTSAITTLVSFDVDDNFIVYGGLKNQSVSASATNPLASYPSGYEITTNTDSSMGYVLGAAVEQPEIALRVALTYHSKIKHDLTIVEKVGGVSFPTKPMSFYTPEAVNLDFQTGIAENTLLFGSVRHVKWKQFKLEPHVYTAGGTTAPLKEFTADSTSYSIGLGRKFTDQWSAAVTYGTEAAEGVEGGPLGPTDGYSKMGVGLTYTGDKASVTLGVQQIDLGNINLNSSGLVKAGMTSNTSLVTAVKVGYKF